MINHSRNLDVQIIFWRSCYRVAAEASTKDLYQNIAILLLFGLSIGVPIVAARIYGRRAEKKLAREIKEIIDGFSF